MGAKQAAEYYRDEAAKAVRRAAQATIHKERPAREAKHHALAADALDALAVPGVADLLKDLSAAALVRMYDDRDNMVDERPASQQRAALATLAKIGRGE